MSKQTDDALAELDAAALQAQLIWAIDNIARIAARIVPPIELREAIQEAQAIARRRHNG